MLNTNAFKMMFRDELLMFKVSSKRLRPGAKTTKQSRIYSKHITILNVSASKIHPPPEPCQQLAVA